MLELINICKKAGVFSLRDISFSLTKGDYFMLVGESGSGKTMILEMICGLLNPDSGKIMLNQSEINNIPIQKRKIGLVYQSETLFPHLTVFENIAYPLKSQKLNRSEIRTRVEQLAADTEISHLLQRSTAKLSGGEAQRVAIARTLAIHPDVLLLDEPLSFLDVQLKKGLSALLRKLNRNGQTILHVTHDYDEVIALANKVALLENGTIIQKGTPLEVFHHPKSSFVASFVGIKNFYWGKLTASDHDTELKIFAIENVEVNVLTDEAPGTEGYIIIPGESVTVSEQILSSSAVNNFRGSITDIFPIKPGFEVVIDIGIEICAQVTHQSIDRLHLETGKQVWVNFKASSVSFIGN
jgi:molybdate/tungstate transport system ATP-binding protein